MVLTLFYLLLALNQLIFDTLYWVLAFGYTEEGGGENPLDPPTDFFRVRMVATLLEACGGYFDHGPPKRKLDDFLVYFQRYLLAKSALPMDVEFDVQDLFDLLRPKLVRLLTFDAAHAECLRLEECLRQEAAVRFNHPTGIPAAF